MFHKKCNERIQNLLIDNSEQMSLIQQMIEEKSNLQDQLKEAQVRIVELELEKADPRKVIEGIMKKKIEFVEVSKLNLEEQTQYHLEAQKLSKNWILINEKNYLINCWAKWAYQNSEDFEGVRDMRMSGNGLQLLLERLESIPDPRSEQSTEEVFNGV